MRTITVSGDGGDGDDPSCFLPPCKCQPHLLHPLSSRQSEISDSCRSSYANIRSDFIQGREVSGCNEDR